MLCAYTFNDFLCFLRAACSCLWLSHSLSGKHCHEESREGEGSPEKAHCQGDLRAKILLLLGWIYIVVSCQDSVEKVRVVKALPKAKVAKASLHALRLHVQ